MTSLTKYLFGDTSIKRAHAESSKEIITWARHQNKIPVVHGLLSDSGLRGKSSLNDSLAKNPCMWRQFQAFVGTDCNLLI